MVLRKHQIGSYRTSPIYQILTNFSINTARNSLQTMLKNKINYLIHPGLAYLITCVLLIITGYAVIRSINWPLVQDGPVMHYIAQRMLAGAVPYRQIFDINLPGSYLFSLFIIRFLGSGSLAWRLFDLAWLLATALIAGLFCYRFSNLAAVLSFIFVIAYHLNGGPYDVGQRDFFLVIMLLGASFFFAKYVEKKNAHYPLFVSGLCIGFSITIKHTPALLAFIFSAIVIWIKIHHPKEILKDIGLLAAGCAIIPIAILIWLVSNNALNSFIQIMVQFNLQIYTHFYNLSFIDLLATILIGENSYWIVLVFFLPIIILFKNKLRQTPRFWIAMAGLLAGILHFFVQDKGWRYHLYPYSVFLLILIAIVISEYITKDLISRLFALVSLCLVAFILASNLLAISNTDQSLIAIKPVVPQLVSDLQSFHLSNTDTVQVMGGAEGGLQALYMLNMKEPTRFIYDVQFLYHPEKQFVKDVRTEFVQSLITNKPKLIIIFKTEYMQPDNGVGRFDNFPEFINLLNNNYHIDPSRNDYVIYELKQY
jgi:hypothetical protein